MPKVYIAAPWKHKDEARAVRNLLNWEGIPTTSRWVDRPETEYECAPELMTSEAQRDLEDLSNADCVLYLNLAKSEGKATELGWAIRAGLPIYVVGGKLNNVFLHLPFLNHLESVEDFIGKAHEGSL